MLYQLSYCRLLLLKIDKYCCKLKIPIFFQKHIFGGYELGRRNFIASQYAYSTWSSQFLPTVTFTFNGTIKSALVSIILTTSGTSKGSSSSAASKTSSSCTCIIRLDFKFLSVINLKIETIASFI